MPLRFLGRVRHITICTMRYINPPFILSRSFVPIGIEKVRGLYLLGQSARLVSTSLSSSGRVAPAPACTVIPCRIA